MPLTYNRSIYLTQFLPQAVAGFDPRRRPFQIEQLKRVIQVDQQLAELRNLTAPLVVEVDQVGAEVLVDGEVVGRTPLEQELRLSPGSHDLEVRLEGFEPVKVKVLGDRVNVRSKGSFHAEVVLQVKEGDVLEAYKIEEVARTF